MRVARVLKIFRVVVGFGLDEFLFYHPRAATVRSITQKLLFWRRLNDPRGVRLRLALETLGPVFVKFGQALSTRRDLIPHDIANELAKLQDQVPPFPGIQARGRREQM